MAALSRAIGFAKFESQGTVRLNAGSLKQEPLLRCSEGLFHAQSLVHTFNDLFRDLSQLFLFCSQPLESRENFRVIGLANLVARVIEQLCVPRVSAEDSILKRSQHFDLCDFSDQR